MGREKREELHVTVPSLFRCPISMDVMKSPVSLCTGVTYDRSSIQTWLSQGHNTCPATMQVLPSTEVIPNLTLRRLIHLWIRHNSDDVTLSSSSSSTTPQQALDVIYNLSSDKLNSLNKIVDFLNYSDENRRVIARSDNAVSEIIEVLNVTDEIKVCEAVVSILDLISSEVGAKEKLNKFILRSDRDLLSRFILILQKGSLNAKIKSVKILELIAFNPESHRRISEKQGVLHELYSVITGETDQFVIEAGLSALITISSSSRPIKKELIRFGIVRTASKLLVGAETVVIVEKAMKMLEIVATCTEGRAAIVEDGDCVVEIVKRLMKCSRTATEYGITVVWSVCCMARDEKAKDRVMKVNGLTKVLLVMQSDCSADVRHMCGDLVKVLRVNNVKSSLASYTKTTHIMPY